MDIEYERDEQKNSINQEKHKLSFEVAILIWDSTIPSFFL